MRVILFRFLYDYGNTEVCFYRATVIGRLFESDTAKIPVDGRRKERSRGIVCYNILDLAVFIHNYFDVYFNFSVILNITHRQFYNVG